MASPGSSAEPLSTSCSSILAPSTSSASSMGAVPLTPSSAAVVTPSPAKRVHWGNDSIAEYEVDHEEEEVEDNGGTDTVPTSPAAPAEAPQTPAEAVAVNTAQDLMPSPPMQTTPPSNSPSAPLAKVAAVSQENLPPPALSFGHPPVSPTQWASPARTPLRLRQPQTSSPAGVFTPPRTTPVPATPARNSGWGFTASPGPAFGDAGNAFGETFGQAFADTFGGDEGGAGGGFFSSGGSWPTSGATAMTFDDGPSGFGVDENGGNASGNGGAMF